MENINKIECAVIGAGVIGLAVARELTLNGREVIILEAESSIGTGTSSRNSEVIHAGIYYQSNSLKARLCVEGKKNLYNYCKTRGVPFKRCGKLIVAANKEQIHNLQLIHRKAIENNVNDLIWLNQNEVYELEPELSAFAALFSPSTGIVDSHALMLSYQGDAENNGAVTAFNSPILTGEIKHNSILLNVGGSQPTKLSCQNVINCAGLHAQSIANKLIGLNQKYVPEIHYAKGNYFSLIGKNPFKHLIYPIPEEAGLGTHLTLDLGGQARFGPDVEWIKNIDYSVDASRGQSFHNSIQNYWPGIKNHSLQPSYSGIRPKLNGATGTSTDFMISGPQMHGVEGLVNLFGIESPGLTASLAISKEVIKHLRQ